YGAPISSGPMAVTAGSMKSESTALCLQGDLPLLSYRPLGAGLVVFTAFDATSQPLRAWSGEPAMWEEILRVGVSDLRATEVFKQSAEASVTNRYSRTSPLADALAGVQATEAPSFTFI